MQCAAETNAEPARAGYLKGRRERQLSPPAIVVCLNVLAQSLQSAQTFQQASPPSASTRTHSSTQRSAAMSGRGKGGKGLGKGGAKRHRKVLR